MSDLIYGLLLCAAMITGAAILGFIVEWIRNTWRAFQVRRAEVQRERSLAKSHLDLVEEYHLDRMTREGLAFWLDGMQVPPATRRDIIRHLQARAEFNRRQYDMPH